MADVQVSWECYEKVRQRYERFGLPTPIYKIISEASIGKAHLRAIGISGWRDVQPDVPDRLIATIMETYYGGRAECHIRLTSLPGVATDVTAEYPTVFVLQDLWPFLIGRGVAWSDEDPAIVQSVLDRLSVGDLLDPAIWRTLSALVLLEPDGLLPTRANYAGGSVYNVGINRRTDGPPQWWTLADAMLSTLSTGRAPRVLRTLRFSPLDPQDGLTAIDVAGDASYRIDPYRNDLIKRMVELRAEIKDRSKREKLPLLDAVQQAMKARVNSVSYGIPVEMNVVEHRRPVPVTVYRPDDITFRTKKDRIEEPGAYFHPLVATLVAGGGRLMLALIMALVTEAGGTYVFCDTDSLFIVATEQGGLIACEGGPEHLSDGRSAVRALSWARVDQIVDQLRSLNPFDGVLAGRSILKVEDENFDPQTGAQREIECLSIAAKRYALVARSPDGRPILLGHPGGHKRSEHGLGHLLPPAESDPEVEDLDWVDRWWEHLIAAEWGVADPDPLWFDAVAAGRLTVTSPHEERNFRTFNGRRPYEDRIRPWNFLMMAFPKTEARLRKGAPRSLVSPFEANPRRRVGARWIDRESPGNKLLRIRTGGSEYVVESSVSVASYRDVFDEYRTHREAKAAGADGLPCQEWTRGLLQPLEVSADCLIRIGKEANRLTASDLVEDSEEHVIEFDEALCLGCGETLTGRRRMWCSESCRKQLSRAAASQRKRT